MKEICGSRDFINEHKDIFEQTMHTCSKCNNYGLKSRIYKVCMNKINKDN